MSIVMYYVLGPVTYKKKVGNRCTKVCVYYMSFSATAVASAANSNIS